METAKKVRSLSAVILMGLLVLGTGVARADLVVRYTFDDGPFFQCSSGFALHGKNRAVF